MIENVTIGGIVYAIHLASKRPALDGSNDKVLGEIDYGNAVIYIEDEQSEQIKRQTLVHEIVHGIFQQTGHYDIDESVIVALGYQLTALIRGNPALIEYLTGKDSE